IIKRANTGIGPDDIRASDRLLEIFAGCRAEIVGLTIGDRNLGRVTLIVLIGCANQGELILVGDGEYDTPVIVLEEIGTGIGELLAHHNMATLNKPDIVKLSISFDTLQNLVGPGTSSIDQQTSPNFLALMCTGI